MASDDGLEDAPEMSAGKAAIHMAWLTGRMCADVALLFYHLGGGYVVAAGVAVFVSCRMGFC